MTEAKKYASKRVSSTDYPVYNDEYELELAFEEGAKWQRNNIWHKPDEPIENDAEVLIEYETGFHDVACYDKNEDVLYTGAVSVKRKYITRWAYIKDFVKL